MAVEVRAESAIPDPWSPLRQPYKTPTIERPLSPPLPVRSTSGQAGKDRRRIASLVAGGSPTARNHFTLRHGVAGQGSPDQQHVKAALAEIFRNARGVNGALHTQKSAKRQPGRQTYRTRQPLLAKGYSR